MFTDVVQESCLGKLRLKINEKHELSKGTLPNQHREASVPRRHASELHWREEREMTRVASLFFLFLFFLLSFFLLSSPTRSKGDFTSSRWIYSTKRCLSRWILSANENGVPLSVPLLDQGKQRDLPGGGSWRGSKSVTVDAQKNR